jgi:hypothetical protein
LQELQHVAHEMEQSANVCSMVTAMKWNKSAIGAYSARV